MSNAELGQKLRDLRGNRPRAEVADAIGVTVSALSMYENGQRVPRDQIKVKFAEYYQQPVQDIFFG
jgi:transcriptional regulator with XRE-family HTH domain